MIKEIIEDKQIERLNDIYRWSFYKVHKHENIPQHSYWVAFFTNLIVEELLSGEQPKSSNGEQPNKVQVLELKLKALQYSLYHDLDEIFTGDISHEVKNNKHNGVDIRYHLETLAKLGMQEKFNNLEASAFGSCVISSTLDKEKHISSIVKLADWLSFVKFAHNEVLLGNHQFNEIMKYCLEKCSNQSIFCENTLKKFELESDLLFDFKILKEIKELKW